MLFPSIFFSHRSILPLIKTLELDIVWFMKTPAFARHASLIVFLVGLNFVGVSLVSAQMNDDGQPPYLARTEPVTLGVVEEVVLNPWGVNFSARVDTGADLSSLDARDIVVHDKVVEFKLGRRWGSRRLKLPVVDWRRVQTAMGVEKRPVVEISICLGSKHFRTLATLKDRSEMIYPFLVGRSALSENFLVDPSRSKAAGSGCRSTSLASSQAASPAKE
jgi:hypothetical protein